MNKQIEIIEYGLTEKDKLQLKIQFKNYMVDLQREFEFSKIAGIFEENAFIWAHNQSLEDNYGLEEFEDYIPISNSSICPKESYIRAEIDYRLNCMFNEKISNVDELELKYAGNGIYELCYATDSGRFIVGIYVFLNRESGELWIEPNVKFVAFDY